jgi:class III poly(R)-hydroxyalkanoic acid synthase PhaE subunit
MIDRQQEDGMSKQDQGAGGGGQAQDFERLARQYWAAWGDALRGAMPDAGQIGAHAWHEAIDWWTRYAHGGRQDVNDALQRFGAQAREWFARMQQVAAQFAGREADASDIARAWKQALGASGASPFPELLRSMRGQGLAGLDQWVEDAKPWLDAVRNEGMSWLRIPAFGAGREHQERLQALARALVEYDEATSAYNALLLKATEHAFVRFEDKLAERAAPGKQIESTRALFDLWIDAAEEAYAQIALSPEFRTAYGRLVDAQMRVRAGVHAQVEQACASLGMPTRAEVDSAHRKIVELERALRRLRDAVGDGQAASAAGSGGIAGASSGRQAAKKPAAKKRAGRKSASRPSQTTKAADRSAPGASTGKPAKKAAARTKAPARRAARKLAPRPTVTARRAPTNGFSSFIPIPDAPLPPEPAPARRRGGR